LSLSSSSLSSDSLGAKSLLLALLALLLPLLLAVLLLALPASSESDDPDADSLLSLGTSALLRLLAVSPAGAAAGVSAVGLGATGTPRPSSPSESSRPTSAATDDAMITVRQPAGAGLESQTRRAPAHGRPPRGAAAGRR